MVFQVYCCRFVCRSSESPRAVAREKQPSFLLAVRLILLFNRSGWAGEPVAFVHSMRARVDWTDLLSKHLARLDIQKENAREERREMMETYGLMLFPSRFCPDRETRKSRLISITSFEDGKPKQFHYFYDENGRLEKEERKGMIMNHQYGGDGLRTFSIVKEKGIITGRFEYTYEGGNLVRFTVRQGRSVISLGKMGYDDQGRMVWESRKYDYSTFPEEFRYIYDDQGRLVSESRFTIGEDVKEYEYDKRGRLVKIVGYHRGLRDNCPEDREKFFYFRGRMLRHEIYWYGKLHEVISYEYQGRVITATSSWGYDGTEDRIKQIKEISKYDSRGNLIEFRCGRPFQRYELTYDRKFPATE